MDQISTLERVFTYKAKANEETLVAMRQFDDASAAKEIAIRVLNHTYAVDRIFDLLADLRLDLFGRRAGIRDGHSDYRDIDLGQQVHSQCRIGECSNHH